MPIDVRTTDEVLELEVFDDGRVAIGHHPRSLYVERFWLPILGPGTTLLIRQIALRLEAGEHTCRRSELAASLGLGDGPARRAAFARCVERAVHFDVVRMPTPTRLAVALLLPPISPRHRLRLSETERALEARMDGVERVRVSGRS